MNVVACQLAPAIGFIVAALHRAGVPLDAIREVVEVAESHDFGGSWFEGEPSDTSKALAFALSTLLAAVRAEGVTNGQALVGEAIRVIGSRSQRTDIN